MLAAKIAVLAAGTALLQWIMAAIHNRVCFAVTRDVRRQAFAHLQRLPLAISTAIRRAIRSAA